MSETTDKIKIIAALMAKGETADEIAAAFEEPKLFIENTMNFIKEITAISSSKLVISDKLDFVEFMSTLREIVSGTFAGACITAEYGNNRHRETEISFSFGDKNYTLSLCEED